MLNTYIRDKYKNKKTDCLTIPVKIVFLPTNKRKLVTFQATGAHGSNPFPSC
jgi:hypothetical protein